MLRVAEDIEGGGEKKPGRSGKAAGSREKITRAVHVRLARKLRRIDALRRKDRREMHHNILITHRRFDAGDLPDVTPAHLDTVAVPRCPSPVAPRWPDEAADTMPLTQ